MLPITQRHDTNNYISHCFDCLHLKANAACQRTVEIPEWTNMYQLIHLLSLQRAEDIFYNMI